MDAPDADEAARRLARESASDAPTGWFEQLYASAERGEAGVPWDRGEPQRLLVEWAERKDVRGDGRRAVVVGCGLGDDAEYVAERGFSTVAFDVSPTGVATARQRHPGSAVDYVVADLLALPAEWTGAYELVVESYTVQSMPVAYREASVSAVTGLVAPGGVLLVIAAARHDQATPDGPPWPLSRDDLDLFTRDGLDVVRLEDIRDDGETWAGRWRVELRRPAASG